MTKKVKGKSIWLVYLDYPAKGDTLRTLDVVYSGPDKSKARDKAAKALADGKKEVFVTRLRDVTRLTADSVVSVLPRSAF